MSTEDKFCSSCGSSLQVREMEGRQRPVCSECSRVVYYDPKIAATSIIERDGKVLLIRRAGEPGLGLWSMPGGYVDRGEMVEEAAAREAREETGLEVEIDCLLGLFSEAGHPVIVAAYVAHETGGCLQPGPEALEVGFFYPNHLPPMAFPRDQQILSRWQDLRVGD
jgi:ADP-ribose pyrophosphatase YjhB (NUDIX family)